MRVKTNFNLLLLIIIPSTFLVFHSQVLVSIAIANYEPDCAYSPNSDDINKKVVADRKLKASSMMVASNVQIRNEKSIFNIEGFGMAFELSGKIMEGDHYSLIGYDKNGKHLEIPFSMIEKIKINSKHLSYPENKRSINLSVWLFPNITATELVIKKPSYHSLRKNYYQGLEITLITQNNNGPMLKIIGGIENKTAIANVNSLTVGSTISLQPIEPYFRWWAIPSVCEGLNYPYQSLPAGIPE